MSTRVMVVDDDHTTQTMMRVGLSKEGYNALIAHNGRDALMKIGLHKPDIIFCDVFMPDADGVDFLTGLKAKPETKSIPLVMMTGNSQMEAGFRKIGVTDFMKKPFTIQDVVSRIKTHATQQPHADEA